ncbi:Autophagy- protein 9A [Perkinsus chesapeaki]|uniref:Autophagy-related protein 9 n=1 Tax=Perkinsus chesapeaki TaxID=330153 RepID=A0A7J6L9R5_PERCH|nr:Autophagy- protein 9A [Perkinsus chesapeaki]
MSSDFFNSSTMSTTLDGSIDQTGAPLWQSSSGINRGGPQKVSDIEKFLAAVYNYYRGGGFYGILGHTIGNLLAVLFTITFAFTLSFLVDWSSLLSCTAAETCASVHLFKTNPFAGMGFTKLILFLSFIVTLAYWGLAAVGAFMTIKEARDAAFYYQDYLGIPLDSDKVSFSPLQAVSWAEVARRLVRLQNGSSRAEEGLMNESWTGQQTWCMLQSRITTVEMTNLLLRDSSYAMLLQGEESALLHIVPSWVPLRGHFIASNAVNWIIKTLILPCLLDEHSRQLFPEISTEEFARGFRKRLRLWGLVAFVTLVPVLMMSFLFTWLKLIKYVCGSIAAALFALALWDDSPLLHVVFAGKNLLWYLAVSGALVSLVSRSNDGDGGGRDKSADGAAVSSSSSGSVGMSPQPSPSNHHRRAPSSPGRRGPSSTSGGVEGQGGHPSSSPTPLSAWAATMRLLQAIHHLPEIRGRSESYEGGRVDLAEFASNQSCRFDFLENFERCKADFLSTFYIDRIRIILFELYSIILCPFLLTKWLPESVEYLIQYIIENSYEHPTLGHWCIYGCLDDNVSLGDLEMKEIDVSKLNTINPSSSSLPSPRVAKAIVSFTLTYTRLTDDGLVSETDLQEIGLPKAAKLLADIEEFQDKVLKNSPAHSEGFVSYYDSSPSRRQGEHEDHLYEENRCRYSGVDIIALLGDCRPLHEQLVACMGDEEIHGVEQQARRERLIRSYLYWYEFACASRLRNPYELSPVSRHQREALELSNAARQVLFHPMFFPQTAAYLLVTNLDNFNKTDFVALLEVGATQIIFAQNWIYGDGSIIVPSNWFDASFASEVNAVATQHNATTLVGLSTFITDYHLDGILFELWENPFPVGTQWQVVNDLLEATKTLTTRKRVPSIAAIMLLASNFTTSSDFWHDVSVYLPWKYSDENSIVLDALDVDFEAQINSEWAEQVVSRLAGFSMTPSKLSLGIVPEALSYTQPTDIYRHLVGLGAPTFGNGHFEDYYYNTQKQIKGKRDLEKKYGLRGLSFIFPSFDLPSYNTSSLISAAV